MNSSKTKITAFHGIFEERLTKLVKHIKKIRKDPASKEKVKQLIFEAKELKKLVKKEKVKPVTHTLEIEYNIVDGHLELQELSSPSKLSNIEAHAAGGLLVINFEM